MTIAIRAGRMEIDAVGATVKPGRAFHRGRVWVWRDGSIWEATVREEDAQARPRRGPRKLKQPGNEAESGFGARTGKKEKGGAHPRTLRRPSGGLVNG